MSYAKDGDSEDGAVNAGLEIDEISALIEVRLKSSEVRC